MIDRGPSSYMLGFKVEQKRVSADYRFVKNKAPVHQIKYMTNNDPVRRGINLKEYTWVNKDPVNYDDDDVLVIEGTKKNTNMIRLFIGMDNYKIYKVDVINNNPNPGKSMNSTYVYKKNSLGNLYLSYFVKQWKGAGKLTENIKRALKNSGQKVREYAPIEYRHEAYVLSIEENKKKFNAIPEILDKDMTDYKVPYNSSFWEKVELPPETNFYKKNRLELESHFGVALETQFKFSN
jgi:hypothetical protein